MFWTWGAKVARNKYPEVTVEKILDVSQKLFVEKGYEATTIQDIVDKLDGLTKGAIYHHFKSKEEIFGALTKKMFFANNPFTIVKQRKDLNGLEKMREVIMMGNFGDNPSEVNSQNIPLLKNPRLLVAHLEANRDHITPLWLELIEEGKRDGSIQTNYPSEVAELMQLLPSVWLNPSIYPMTPEEIYQKCLFLKDVFAGVGIPVFDDEIMARVKTGTENIGTK